MAAPGGAPPFRGVHPTALIHDEATLAADAAVGAWTLIERGARVGARSVVYPGCYIGAGCRIGVDCTVYPHAVLYPDVELGDRVVVHAGAVLGADGFGFVFDGTRHVKIPQVGRVEIGSDVELGAQVCVDRGALDETAVEAGAKLDNLCHVAHNVRIGAHTVVAAQTGIAGSSRDRQLRDRRRTGRHRGPLPHRRPRADRFAGRGGEPQARTGPARSTGARRPGPSRTSRRRWPTSGASRAWRRSSSGCRPRSRTCAPGWKTRSLRHRTMQTP